MLFRSPIGLPSKQGTGTDFHYVDWGVYEYMMRAKTHLASETPDPAKATHGIATAWVADSVAETVTFTIRTGVMFHDGWGELTAEDVAFSFNEGNKEGTTFSRSQKDRVDLDRKSTRLNSSYVVNSYAVFCLKKKIKKKNKNSTIQTTMM